jgi:DNA ligase-1
MSKQASLASFFGGPKAAPKKKSESTSKKSDGKKTSKKDVLIDTDDEVEEIIVPATKAKAPPKATPKAKATITAEKKNAASVLTTTETATRSKKKKLPDATVKEVEESKGKKGTKNARPKRQKILEDSSDEEMEVDVNNVDSVEDEDEDEDEDEPMVHKKKEIHEDEDEGNADDDNYIQEQDDDEEEDDEHDEEHDEEDEGSDEEEEGSEEDEPLKALKDKPKAKVKPNAFDKLKQAPSAKSTTSSSSSKPNKTSSAASLLSSTEEIEANTSWKKGTPALYSTLCQTLGEIEAISSRLEIQKQLTNLFRLTFLKNPTDLLTLVYLASNSVAAAYECVELGIGDSLLIKAIGEASGSQAKMIKLKYETDGDLGVVAMTAKGKQRTLGFGIKPKPLSAFEVLEVFRQIATTTGSQSQKWKINKIKGLLVRVQDPTESKYIVRGLQGKLRIGLAQSTVLTSLAHAVLLSGPVKEEEVEDEKEEDETQLSTDAKNVKNEKMPLETRLEAAVNIIKKAYSEVSSFDALVDALLKAPISQLNKTCTLRPGMPVEPMLAKPTKSIQEVLKRLNGKRFTCEFKYDGERAQVHMDEKGVTKVSEDFEIYVYALL